MASLPIPAQMPTFYWNSMKNKKQKPTQNSHQFQSHGGFCLNFLEDEDRCPGKHRPPARQVSSAAPSPAPPPAAGGLRPVLPPGRARGWHTEPQGPGSGGAPLAAHSSGLMSDPAGVRNLKRNGTQRLSGGAQGRLVPAVLCHEACWRP